jgi:hypothetical protein
VKEQFLFSATMIGAGVAMAIGINSKPARP